MNHDHAHGHAHDHGHAKAPSHNRAFVIGIALNVAFVSIESVFGVLAHSTALLADAAHNLSDVLGLLMAWAAATLARRPASRVHTYGFRRSTILAALANALLLIGAVGAVAWEAIGRLRVPAEAHAGTMMWVAAAGVVVNAVSAFFFHERGGAHAHAHGHGDMNMRGAFLHLLADAAVSAGVVIAGLVLMQTGWRWVDPVTSLIVSVVILFGTWSLLRDALHLAMDGVPKHIDVEKVRAYLAALPEVSSVHDLHIWAMSTTEVALTAHLVVPWKSTPPAFLAGIDHALEEHFGIAHTTLQLEPLGSDCALTAEACTPTV
jgi:cobalt-zinc-cadmium efflux system protein